MSTDYQPQSVIVGQPETVIIGSTTTPFGSNIGNTGRPAKMMHMMDAVKSCLQKSFDFNGRASRSEYWWFYLAFNVITTLFGVIAVFMWTITGSEVWTIIVYLPYLLYLPLLSAGVRRIHDHGKSGWLILVPLYNFYLTIVEGEGMPNAYGPVPTNQLH